jgi:signal transduction histidine kinase
LLINLLNSQGYKTRPVSDGLKALAVAQKAPPDLILLDIMMPDLDGYQVCQRLKADERTCNIPIIFLSALDELFDKVKAFAVGGVDYITKPFHEAEVLARVRTHLTLRQTQQNLIAKNSELEAFAQTVVAQNKELDVFARTVAHDLKNPLGVILSYIQMWRVYATTMPPSEIEIIGQQLSESAQSALNIVEELLFLASVRKEEVTLEPLNMAEILFQVHYQLAPMITEYHGTLTLPDSWPRAQGHAPWIQQVWVNYISNGLKYGGRPPQLTLGATPQANGQIRFWIQDNGQGLTPEAQAKLFAEFVRLDKVRATGHGLGLTIVQRIINKLGGEVGVQSEVGQGCLFYFTLPMTQ